MLLLIGMEAIPWQAYLVMVILLFIRDPNGIRPAFWYEDDEVFVVTSERPVIQTAFNVKWEKINELKPGSALIIKKKIILLKKLK